MGGAETRTAYERDASEPSAVGAGTAYRRHRRRHGPFHHAARAEKIHEKSDRHRHCVGRRRRQRYAAAGHRDAAARRHPPNGAYVVGESNIFGFKKQQDCRIDHVELLPAHPKALPDALDAIAAADLILLGPGSLYTSIIPNLLVDGVAEAIAASDAQKIYVCNIMTQDGETEGYTAADHLAALLRHGTADMVELCLANSSPIPPELAERYRAEGAEVLTVDRERIAQMGIELVERPLASPSGDFARHDPDALASAVLDIYRARAVHIYGGRESYRIEK